MTTTIPASLIPKTESAEQSVTANSNAIIAHGLGRLPSDLQIFLRCKTADLGYAIGDEVCIGQGGYSSLFVVTSSQNATNIIITTQLLASIQLLNKSTFTGPTAITAASWRYVAKYR